MQEEQYHIPFGPVCFPVTRDAPTQREVIMTKRRRALLELAILCGGLIVGTYYFLGQHMTQAAKGLYP